jgi:large subunit ribosomal protein L17
MRHRHGGHKLSRKAQHRIAMFRNMTMALIRHERIITTVAKARALRPFVEKLITLARKGDLHSRRQVASKLGRSGEAEVVPPEANGDGTTADPQLVLQKLFAVIGPRFKDRPGGYTRIVKRHQRRLGDASETAYIELLKEGETRVKKERAPAPTPAPEIPAVPPEEPKAEAPKSEEPKSETPTETPS